MRQASLQPKTSGTLLHIEDLHTYFFTRERTIRALDGVDMRLARSVTAGIVGESGCGKTMLALSVMRLVPSPGKIVSGHIWFEDKDLLELDEESMRNIRGGKISMIFQEPMTSLNPVFTIGDQVAETIALHQKELEGSKSLAFEKAIEVLGMVGIPNPEKRVKDYPHQLSGGMRQRVMIGIAIACRPKLMIADEPTTALDVTSQAQILELMERLKQEINTSIILVTHDLGVVAEACQDVSVMYMGRVIESSRTDTLFANPLHPYTTGLMRSRPVLGKTAKSYRLKPIPGTVPTFRDVPKGCPFHDRCEVAMDICGEEMPPITFPEESHMVRCWRHA